MFVRAAFPVLLASSVATVAHAQVVEPVATTPAVQNDEGAVSDIIVTAQRKSENLQRVPIAITAMNSEMLDNKGIDGLANIGSAVPGLSADQGAGILFVHLRGVGTVANGPGIENQIAMYVDGVYYGTQGVGLAKFNNVDRVEVLKGPQGTLFGRNATGGLIHIITSDPSSTFEANGSASYGNFNAVDAKLYLTGPLANDLAADVGVTFGRHDGYGTNRLLGTAVDGVKHDVSVRSKLLYSPGASKFTLTGDYSDHKGTDNTERAFRGFRGPGEAAPVILPNPWDSNTDFANSLRIRSGGVSLKSEFGFADIDVMNLTAYRKTEFRSLFDYDAGPFPLTSVALRQDDRQFSNELQISSQAGDALKWTVGAYYFWADAGAVPNDIILARDPMLNPLFPVGMFRINGVQETESYSAFGQATYEISSRVSLTGGVRYTIEERSIDSATAGTLYLPNDPVVPLGPRVVDSRRYKRPTFRGALEYKPADRILLYASVNTGFKSGGFNVMVPSDAPYLPERLTAYEIGEKIELFDRRVRVNSAAFYYDYKNIQIIRARTTGVSVINGASARIYGLDIDTTFRASKDLELTASATLIKSRYGNFPIAPFATPGGGVPLYDGDASGNRVPYTPKLSFNLAASYTIPVGDDNLVLNGNLNYSSKYFFEPDQVTAQDRYANLGARARYNFSDGRYFVEAYGENLTNNVVTSIVLTTPSGSSNTSLQAPRTYGVTVGFSY